MTTERIGFRRLYDAVGCLLANRDELQVSFPIAGMHAQVYFGPRPRFGIAVIEKGESYAAPGTASFMSKIDYHRDATESKYPRAFFTEIACWKEIEVPQDLSDAFHSQRPEAHIELLQMAARDSQFFRQAIDVIAGVIGLRVHRQFILDLINENYLVLRGEDDFAHNVASPAIELLDEITLNSVGQESIGQLLPAIGQANDETLKFAAQALGWLQRAWHIGDAISKFTALFTAIETVLQGSSGTLNSQDEKLAAQIRDAISSTEHEERDTLLAFFDRIIRQQRPSLVSRFEALAQKARLTGWEADITAFKRFNSMRNALVHRGKQEVDLVISVSDDELRQIEDIAERYVSWALFRDGVVYQSSWRAARKPSRSGDS